MKAVLPSLLGPQHSIRIGPFTVDAAGRLHPPSGEAAQFRCFWQHRAIHARLRDTRLDLRASAGRIPSTARPEGAARREGLFSLLRLLPRSLPAHWRAELAPDHTLRLGTEIELPQPLTPVELLSALACFALQAAPYLDLLDEEGLAAMGGAEPGGMAKTCPG